MSLINASTVSPHYSINDDIVTALFTIVPIFIRNKYYRFINLSIINQLNLKNGANATRKVFFDIIIDFIFSDDNLRDLI